ncbi:hypothetical protein WICMUC_000395 [Wickerhamomyces mucosus]|uniref:Uncharacterized protein n=1 Tax=Wickerhamomyces mucosus TaxID=1378264 RepID=A0A9P8TI13_9ASCO|nr:hypothetical protein WICMUC_000395 [Wickerhamomyces mucosus]
MIGAPYFSHNTIVTKTKNPKPINWADPHGAAFGPELEGQIVPTQPDPPNQSSNPDWINEIPIKRTTGPVTTDGNNFCKKRGGINDKNISNNAQTAPVPRIAPYPSGQANLVPSSAIGHTPLAYIMGNDLFTIEIVAKEVPKTESKPEPI